MTRWTRGLLVMAAMASHALAAHAQAPVISAAAPPATSESASTAPRAFLSANAPARWIHLGSGRQPQSLSFVASAGETLSLKVDGNRAASACDAGVVVEDAAGRTVARQRCFAGAGQRLEFAVPSSGVYSARFRAGDGAVATLQVSLSSPQRLAREAAVLQACDTRVLPLDKTVSGTWDSGCESVSYSGHYARYYRVSVPQTQVVTFSLGSGVNPSLVLHDGTSPQGTVIAADSDRGPGDAAQVVMLLAAGTYTVEATTDKAALAGEFRLAARRNVLPCFDSIKLNTPVEGKWSRACSSQYEDDRYAKYYTFTVPSRRTLTLVLRPAEPTIPRLILRSGATQLGAVVSATSPGAAGFAAAVTLSLEAGTYTIEASSYYPAHTGGFTLSAITAASCTDPLALDTLIDVSLTDACASTFVPGGFAHYYVVTVPSLQVVTFSMVSPMPPSDTNIPYWVVRTGTGPLGPVVAYYYRLNGSIRQLLGPGTYTMEVINKAPQPAQYSVVARTESAPCFSDLAFNTELSGTWQLTCGGLENFASSLHLSNFYRFTVPVAAAYTFEVKSSLPNPIVKVVAGPTTVSSYWFGGTYSNNNSKLIVSLPPGDYLLEVADSNYDESPGGGDYRLTATVNAPSCTAPLALGTPASGTFAKDCSSQTLPGSYAKYYSVVVKSPQVITAIASSAKDAYLVLHDGAGQSAPVLAQDDNAGIGLDAMLTRYLTPGTYTYEVTTAAARQVGDFALSVRGNSEPCVSSIAPGQSVQGAWSEGCISPTLDDHYANFHTFSLTSSRTVSIQLSSATDAYLVLRGGPYQQVGTVLATDDNSGGGTDARIVMTLPSGTYTIEATTGQALRQGAYSLQLN